MIKSLPTPAVLGATAALGVLGTFLLDLALLAPAALAIGVAAACVAAVLLTAPADGESRALRRGLVAPTSLVLAVVVGLLTAVIADLWLIEPVAYALGALAGSLTGPLLYRRMATTLALAFVAVAVAGALAFALTALVLVGTGVDPGYTFGRMLSYGSEPNSVVTVINSATTYYLSAVAVAIGFKMKLFNIGVDGQYRLAALLAAAAGAAWALPPVLHQIAIILVAVAVGGFWAGIAGYLKVARGVSEVISTIMLNAIATGITAYLLSTDRLAVNIGSNNIGTAPIPESGWIPGIPTEFMGAGRPIFGLTLLAVAVGVGYWALLNRTRFGFDLRATGQSASAAEASGVNVRRMVVASMVISGMVAGLVGMPQLLGDSHYYALDFPVGLGFTGIAIALLGRNHPVGIAFAALFWAWLNQSSQILDIDGIPKEIAVVTQATIVLTVVVVYELVHRWGRRYEQQQVGRELGRVKVATS
ncbi:ABC transporter permease [Marinitenerispora sediminis]|uniref:ABC transporter permease n=1 Tax=Marinitenerispora sediminis TaxID=1931232 RepID=A0A368T9Y4_9ACTN|nr:ABC transporter permease [Marinitenerispora sediminis]RCV56852.1 ABC transporter permease [Marinitenerispora sediminis]RCV59027.1 ABC transporter permease [Marinitenerispora sediminis]RCV61561.1 ABC transporter permease [Marinitenerispora sediminis]